MKIEKIEWVGTGDLREGWVTLVAGECRFVAFQYPCFLKEGGTIEGVLFSQGEKFIHRVDPQSAEIKTLDDGLHQILGQLLNLKRRLVKVGELSVALGSHLPGDIREGDFVECVSWRLDL